MGTVTTSGTQEEVQGDLKGNGSRGASSAASPDEAPNAGKAGGRARRGVLFGASKSAGPSAVGGSSSAIG